jgi:uncharacterized membrane protein (DUF441 family)
MSQLPFFLNVFDLLGELAFYENKKGLSHFIFILTVSVVYPVAQENA